MSLKKKGLASTKKAALINRKDGRGKTDAPDSDDIQRGDRPRQQISKELREPRNWWLLWYLAKYSGEGKRTPAQKKEATTSSFKGKVGRGGVFRRYERNQLRNWNSIRVLIHFRAEFHQRKKEEGEKGKKSLLTPVNRGPSGPASIMGAVKGLKNKTEKRKGRNEIAQQYTTRRSANGGRWSSISGWGIGT